MYCPSLQKDIDESKLLPATLIHVCLYQINKESPFPFLQYFLLKETPNNELYFPKFTYDFSLHTDPILELCMNIIFIIFETFSKPGNCAIFKGLIQNEDNIYMFFDGSSDCIGAHLLTETNDIWLTLIDEIVNSGSVFNFKVKDHVRNLFYENSSLIFLKSENGNNIEAPVTAFRSCHPKKVDFITTFKLPATLEPCLNIDDVFGRYGPYYYFTNYISENPIVRFAIFPGNMTITVDDSLINKWSDEKYHSLYLSKNEKSYWVISDYDRQVPLSALTR
jgi:hypothetical protein